MHKEIDGDPQNSSEIIDGSFLIFTSLSRTVSRLSIILTLKPLLSVVKIKYNSRSFIHYILRSRSSLSLALDKLAYFDTKSVVFKICLM